LKHTVLFKKLDLDNYFFQSDGTGFLFRKTDGENCAVFNTDGSVELYHNNSKKFETTSSGVVVTGICTATSFSGDGSGLSGVSGYNDLDNALFG
jgi:hypothetical protein